MFYFGFDLGDGESCIHYSEDLSAGNMQSVPVSGKESFISAVGTRKYYEALGFQPAGLYQQLPL